MCTNPSPLILNKTTLNYTNEIFRMGWTSLFHSTLPRRPEVPFSICYLVGSAIQHLSGHLATVI